MKKVITYGTFDLFHKGHYNILKRAKEEGDYLIVGVTGDNYDIERGKLSVQDSLATRIENVRATGFADKIIVEEYLGQKIHDIIKYNIDELVVGSDWKGKFDHLSKYCEVKYLERTKNISSTELREKTMKILSLGIITDDMSDGDSVLESKHVSGIHVESVFAEDKIIAEEFCQKYELDNGYTDFDQFLDSVDVIYVKTRRELREQYIERSIRGGKHVIVDPPVSLDRSKEVLYVKLAHENNVTLLYNIPTLFLSSFVQLLWMIRGNLIGDIVRIHCTLSQSWFKESRNLDFYDLLYYPLCTIMKCMGTNCRCDSAKKVLDDNGNIEYGELTLNYDNSTAIIEVGTEVDIDSGFTAIGTNGTIIVPEDWWQVCYFEVKEKGAERNKRYSSNIEGNGFRYLLKELLTMIKNEDSAFERITAQEQAAIMNALSTMV